MVNLMARLGGRGRHNGANAIVHLAREVVGRRRTIQNATQEVRNAIILDSLADEDFRALDTTIAERTTSDREFAQTLARLTYAASRAKGFDRCVVDAALRLDSLVPTDDPAHERDRLLRDAYNSAQKASYIRGGRLALGRLGRRAVEAGDLERARVLLHQQLDLGPEKDDTAAEVDSSLVLGDILRREGDDDQAQMFYRRASEAAERLEYRQGVAEALVRQIDTTPSANLETVAALQRQALDAAQRTGDKSLEARILVGLANTLIESERLEDATPYYQSALEIARETSDLALEARCVTALAQTHRKLGHNLDALESERAALAIEERLGNRQAAANWALSLGMSELRLQNAEAAVDAFDRARLLGSQIGDATIQQRAEGSLGIAHTLLGHGPETIDHLSRAIELARQAHDRVQEAQWVSSLGQAYWMFRQVDDAIRVTNDAISLADVAGNVALQAESFTLLGQIYASQRETIRARDCFTRALQLNRDLGQTADQVTTLSALGTLAADTGQFTQASQLFDQALGLALSTDDRTTATVLYGRMGTLAQKRGDLRTALGNYQRAVEMAQTIGDAKLLSRSLQHLATAQDVMGDLAAVTSYERAVTAADDAGDVRGGVTMRLNMGMLISRLPEQGAAEDAIGWLGDAANYALEAGPDYIDLRKQAEQQIQALGGAYGRYPSTNDRSTDHLEHSDEPADRQQYWDDQPERDDAPATFEFDDGDYADGRYDSGSYYRDEVAAPAARDPEDSYGRDDRPGQRVAEYAYDESPIEAAYDDDDSREQPDSHYRPQTSRDIRYEPGRYDDRDGDPDDDRLEGRDRDDFRETEWQRGHDHRELPSSRRSYRNAPIFEPQRSSPVYWDAEGYGDDFQTTQPYPGARPNRVEYVNHGEDGYPYEEPRYRDRREDGLDDGYRSESNQRLDERRSNRIVSSYDADRFDEEPRRDYAGQHENGRDQSPRLSSGRGERGSRQNNGARQSSGRELDDEPSEPDVSRSGRRVVPAGLFSWAGRDSGPGRRRSRGQVRNGRRLDDAIAPPAYDDPQDPDAYRY